MQHSTSRAEAERLLGIAERLLQSKDLNGSRDFAVLAQETEPLLDGSDQILAVIDVLLAAESKKVNLCTHNWYTVLLLEDPYSDDLELIKRSYRRLAFLLHPDKNKFPFSDAAFKLVADGWAILSDPAKKSAYDSEFFRYEKVDLAAMKKQREIQHQGHDKLPGRRGSGATDSGNTAATPANIWTACPYCYNLYEYYGAYEGCCLRCQNCQKAFEAVSISSLPPTVPGKDAYYCCWGFFPMGFANSERGRNAWTPNWMPSMFPNKGTSWPVPDSMPDYGPNRIPPPVPYSQAPGFVNVARKKAPRATTIGPKKRRGRPRKNPVIN